MWIIAAVGLYGVLLLLGFAAGLWIGGQDALTAGPLVPLPEVSALLDREFYGPLPAPEIRARGAVRGLLETLNDPYTVLIDPQPAQQEIQRLAGNYGDVGVSLWWAEAGVIGLSPYPSSPALAAGVREGDRLHGIDGVALTGETDLNAVAWRLQGEAGTTVTLALLRPPAQLFTLTVTRGEVLHPSIQWRLLDEAAGIGYLHIAGFTDQTAVEVADALADLQVQGMTRLALDLRGNGGGVIAPLPRLLGLFLPEGSPIYRNATREVETPVYTEGTPVFTGPLVVLVNGQTASAAEIVAAALQENGRAAVLGARTFGKGSIQSLYFLQDGSTIHVTTALWLTPQGQKLDGAGITPTYSVVEVPGRDAMLEAAISRLKTGD